MAKQTDKYLLGGLLADDRLAPLSAAIAECGTIEHAVRMEGDALSITWGAYVHHSAAPVVAAIAGLVDPATAAPRKDEWGISYLSAVDKISGLDGAESRVIAALGGIDNQTARMAALWDQADDRNREAVYAEDDALSATRRRLFVEAIGRLRTRHRLEQWIAFDAEERHSDGGPTPHAFQPDHADGLVKRTKGVEGIDRIVLLTIYGLHNGSLTRDTFKKSDRPAAEAFAAILDAEPQTRDDLLTALSCYAGW